MKRIAAAAVALAALGAGLLASRPAPLCVQKPTPAARCQRMNPNTDKPEELAGPFPAVQAVGDECEPVECTP